MAEIPTFDGDMNVHPGNAPQASPGGFAQAGAGLAEGAGELSNRLNEFNQHYVEARRVMDASNAMAGLSNQLNDLSFTASKIPDRQQALTTYQAGVAQLRKGSLTQIQDPLTQAYVTERFNAEASARELETGQRSFALESSKRVGDLDLNLAAFAQSAAGAHDDITRAKIADDGIAAIKGAVAGGWIPPEAADAKILGFKSQMQEVSARQLIDRAVQTQDPEDARAAGAAIGDENQFPGMLPDVRERLAYRIDNLSQRLEYRAISRQAHDDAVGERLMREGQQHNEAVMLGNVYSGKSFDMPTLQKLVDGQQISAEGLEAVHRAQSEQHEGSDDALTVGHLWQAIDNHQATPNDLYAAAAAGHLKGSTLAEMMKTLDRGGGETASEKDALGVLDTVMRGMSKGIGANLDPDTAARLGQAQLEFHTRVNTGADPQTTLRDVLHEYAGNLQLDPRLAAPKLGPVTNAADLNRIATATVNAHAAHKISDGDYWSQVQLLGQYKNFFAAQSLLGTVSGGAPKPSGKPAPSSSEQPSP